ncbi:MAG: hypothetical protein II576_02925 [Prevotella sp.]|nr:hypothetical protein [Prevotella sp.]
MSEIDKKNLIEEIANKVVNKIDELEYNTEISNSELWKDLINPNEMDFDELFELNNRIIDLCENKEISTYWCWCCSKWALMPKPMEEMTFS